MLKNTDNDNVFIRSVLWLKGSRFIDVLIVTVAASAQISDIISKHDVWAVYGIETSR